MPRRLDALLLVLGALFLATPARAGKDLARWVDPFIGTGGHGHTYPGPALPFGMIQPGPDTRLTGWDGCSGYHYSDSTVYGFSHTHLSGTGVADYCDVLFLPATGPVKLRNNYENVAGDGYGSRFSKQNERAEAGYYRTVLDDYGVEVALTATPRTAWHRYTFRDTTNAHVLIDLTHRDELLGAWIRVAGPRRIEGLRRSKSWAKDQVVYFAAEFDRDFTATLSDTTKAVLRFRVNPGERVHAKVALSSVDAAGAWKNLEAEAKGWNFEATRKAARRAWNEALAKIEVEGGTDEQRTIFYTALYHTMLQPNLFEDVDGRFRGMDGKVHDSPGYTRYTVFSLWDTFRAAHPLYTIIERERTLDFIQTFLAMYRESGRLPVWELWGNETDCMIGYHAVSVILDAYAKGIRGFDEKLALEAMVATANTERFGIPAYRRYGYIPADLESESVSKTLEYAYDDWCIAEFARRTGRDDVAKEFEARAQSWVHLVDEDAFMRPRGNGRWIAPFEPREVTFHFTEANAWQYRFFVPHDIARFAPFLDRADDGATTGAQALERALDAMFSAESQTTGREQADITGLIGQYAHGNEPSHHVAYLYHQAGAPEKARALVRRIMDEMYRAAPDGLIGNEDCGQMSAWYVLSALGFYPRLPGTTEWDAGESLFTRWKIRGFKRPDGAGPVVSAAAASPPVQAPTVNAPVVFTDSVRVQLVAGDPADTIVYTLDTSEPDAQSRRYAEPFTIRAGGLLRLRALRDGAMSPVVDAAFRKIDPRVKITERNPLHRQYQAGGPVALIDGVRGGTDFRLGTWQGIYGVDLDADVDLGEAREIRRLATGFLHDQNSWIFFPTEVIFSVSDDGENWVEVGRATTDTDPRHDGVVVEDFAVEFERPLRARRVRVVGKSPVMCPDWHKGAGNRAFIFADEIVVE